MSSPIGPRLSAVVTSPGRGTRDAARERTGLRSAPEARAREPFSRATDVERNPQEPLDIAQRRHLIRIWDAVLQASCVEDLFSEESPLEGPAYDGVPRVTPVPLGDPTQYVANTVVLNGGEVAFEPDSAAFRDPASAREVLEPIAAQMVRDGLTATVTGTTGELATDRGSTGLEPAARPASASSGSRWRREVSGATSRSTCPTGDRWARWTREPLRRTAW